MPWDIAGHAAAVAGFRAALAGGRIGHAYMITGPQGIGKAHLARLMGQALLCGDTPDQAPCGVCAGCRQVAAGTHPDLHWLVPEGSGIRIDQVRELQAMLSLRPFSAKYKVCVIDGADLMTEQAQNSMLKSLEEPAGSGILLLVTHRPGALLTTIRSRCLIVRLQPLPVAQLATYLQEKKGWSADVAGLVASLCAGRCGRALAADPQELKAKRDNVVAWVTALRQERVGGALRIATELDKDNDLLETLDMATVWLTDIWHVWLRAGLPVVNADLAVVLEREAGRWQDAARTALTAVIAARRQLQLNANRRLTLDNMLMKMQRGLT